MNFFRPAYLVLFMLLLFLQTDLQAQSQQKPLTIIVVDADDNEAEIAGAEIRSSFFNIKTNASGEATITKYPDAGFHIHVSAPEYRTEEKHIFMKKDISTYTVSLHKLQDTLHTVTVTGYTYEGNNRTTSTSVIDKEKLISTRGQDLGTILKDIPGVSILQTGATISKPVINGLHSNRIVILNHGVKQEGQQWGAEHAPEVDPSLASNIVVVKGADAVRYGADAIGGTILINPPALAYKDALHGEAYLLGTSNALLFGGGATIWSSLKRNPNIAWRLQASGKKGGNYKTAEYYLNNTGINELNFSGEIGYKKNDFLIELYASNYNKEIGIFSGSHVGDTTDLFALIRNGRPYENGSFTYTIDAPRQDINHQLYKLKSSYNFHEKGVMELQYSFQQNNRKEFDLRRGGRSAIPSLDLVLQTQMLNINWLNKYKKYWKTTAGISTEYQSNYSVPGTGVTPLIPNYKNISGGVYAIQNYSKPKFELEAGVRYDYIYLNASGLRTKYKYVDANGNEISPNLPGEYVLVKDYYGGENIFQNFSGVLGVNWKPHNNWRISSNIGLAWRPPHVNELYSEGLHHGSSSIEIGDSTLNSETAYKWISTLSYKKSNLSLELSGYLQWINNNIYLNPSLSYEQSIRGAFPVFNFKQTNATYNGLDFSGKYSFSMVDYLVKTSVIIAKDIKNNEYLPMIPPFSINNALRFNFNDKKVFSDNYVLVESAYTAQQDRYVAGTDFAPPPPGYHILNAELNTRIAQGYNHSVIVNVKMSNILNVLYKDYLDRFRYFNHGMGRNLQLRIIYQF